MAGNAFTAGVKPGGLNSSTEIRILLCYLIKNAASPLTGEELEAALLNEALVNYFEFAACLSDLCEQGLVENGKMAITFFPRAGKWRTLCRTMFRLLCESAPPARWFVHSCLPEKAPSTKCSWKRHPAGISFIAALKRVPPLCSS